MTKPTYSELEAENLRVRGLLQRLVEQINLGFIPNDLGEFEKAHRLKDEIYTIGWQDGEGALQESSAMTNATEWLSQSNFPQSSSLVSQGAESADIGKLDAAEKSGKVNRVLPHNVRELDDARLLGEMIEAYPTADNDDSKWESLYREVRRRMRGSAETGGEKAAPQRVDLLLKMYNISGFMRGDNEFRLKERLLNIRKVLYELEPKLNWLDTTFRRSSQNQTASSGVEGAHEGTTADKNGSREPEKLNNAQKAAVEFLDYAIDMVESDCSTGAIVATLKAAKEALAESSLSHDPNCVCIPCMSKATGELLKRDVNLDPGRCCDNGYFGHPHKCQKSNPESSLSSPPEFLYTNLFPENVNIRIESAASPELLPTQLPKEK